MADITDEHIREVAREVALSVINELTKDVDTNTDVPTVGSVNDAYTLPGYRDVNGTREYVKAPMSVFQQPALDAATAANAAKDNANDAAGRAETAAATANNAAQGVQTAIDGANEAASNANAATTGAERVNAMLGSSGGIVTLTVIDRTGASTSREVGFRIARTFPSEAAMYAAASQVEEGRFVMIASDEEPENGQLYVKTSNSFTFIADLSGAQGIKGDTPVLTATESGVIYSDGTLLTDVIKDAVDDFYANEGSSTSTAGDGTRWGAYKTAENSRDTLYSQSEASRNTQYATAESGRDSQYSQSENSRDSQYSSAESARGSLYESAENARDTASANAEGTSASTAGDGTRWGAYKTAEAARQTAFNSSQTARSDAWDTFYGTSTSTGVQGEWNALKEDAQADHIQAASDHTRAENDHTYSVSATNNANTAAETANTAAASVETELSKLTGDLYPRFEVNTSNMTLVVHHVDQTGRFTIDTNGYLHVNA